VSARDGWACSSLRVIMLVGCGRQGGGCGIVRWSVTGWCGRCGWRGVVGIASSSSVPSNPCPCADPRSELKREQAWSRIHLVPAILAEQDRDAYRRQQAALAREREIMKDVEGWEVSWRGASAWHG
jgi:hypothetical protein